MTGKVYDNHQSCPGKIAYSGRVDANQAAKRFGRKKRSNMNAYQCKACRMWHIGWQNNRSKKPKDETLTDLYKRLEHFETPLWAADG